MPTCTCEAVALPLLQLLNEHLIDGELGSLLRAVNCSAFGVVPTGKR